MRFVRDDKSPALSFRPIGNGDDAAVFHRAEDDVLPLRHELPEKALGRFVAAVFRSLDAPDHRFGERRIAPKQFADFPRFFDSEADLVLRKEPGNFGIVGTGEGERWCVYCCAHHCSPSINGLGPFV